MRGLAKRRFPHFIRARVVRSMQLHRVPQLDGLRAVAVLLVIASHAGLGRIVPGGFGVTIFFFLSGYLITTLLRVEFAATGRIDLRAFYLRRFLRIAPPLYITLLIVNVAQLQGWLGAGSNPQTFVWDYLFLSNYAHLWGQEGGLPIPLWSLAVEEHFYLLFPIFFAVLAKRHSATGVAKICLLLCLISLGFRIIPWELGHDLTRNYYWSHTRMDSILFGSILAMWQNPLVDDEFWRPSKAAFLCSTIILLATFAIRNEAFRQTIRYSLQGISLFVIFGYVLGSKAAIISRILSLSVLAWVGSVSYTLYLCHVAIFAVLRNSFGDSWHSYILGVIGAFVFAQAMRFLVEKPIIAWRRRHPIPEARLSPN